MVAESNKVTTRFIEHGTQQGEMMGAPPSGKQVTVTGIIISRFENGKIVEVWAVFDRLGMLQQLGLIPTAG
jgi:predicted ester cyclase